MVDFEITKNTDVQGFYDFSVVIDTGTITVVNPGLVDENDVYDILLLIKENVESQLAKFEV